jgi:hypothetical protein
MKVLRFTGSSVAGARRRPEAVRARGSIHIAGDAPAQALLSLDGERGDRVHHDVRLEAGELLS